MKKINDAELEKAQSTVQKMARLKHDGGTQSIVVIDRVFLSKDRLRIRATVATGTGTQDVDFGKLEVF